jgi:flagellar hook-length control protein FliK
MLDLLLDSIPGDASRARRSSPAREDDADGGALAGFASLIDTLAPAPPPPPPLTDGMSFIGMPADDAEDTESVDVKALESRLRSHPEFQANPPAIPPAADPATTPARTGSDNASDQAPVGVVPQPHLSAPIAVRHVEAAPTSEVPEPIAEPDFTGDATAMDAATPGDRERSEPPSFERAQPRDTAPAGTSAAPRPRAAVAAHPEIQPAEPVAESAPIRPVSAAPHADPASASDRRPPPGHVIAVAASERAGDRPQIGGPAAAPTGKTDATPPAENRDAIVQQIRLLISRGGGEAHIELEPQHFGQLTLSIRVSGDQVVARVVAETPAVRAWLQANEPALREALAGQDLTLDRLEVVEDAEAADEAADRRGRGEPDQDEPHRRHKPRPGDAAGAHRFEVTV